MLLANQGDMTSWGYRRIVDYLVDRYADHGIELAVTVLEGGAWQDATRDGSFDITLYPLSMPTGTPELFIRRLAYSEGMRVRSIGNTTHYSSATLDSLFDAAVGAASIQTQQALFTAILDLLAREKPVVPLFHERYYFAYRSTLTGVSLDPFLKADLHAIGENNQ
jgi:ABC-type transport system substrate-binding protein